MKAFFLYTISLVLCLILAVYFLYISNSKIYYQVIYRIFIVIEFTLLSMVFYYNISNFVAKKIIQVILIPYILLCVYSYFTSDKSRSDFLPVTIECFILVTYIIYFFIEKIQQETLVPIYLTTIFWIAAAYFLFFSGNFCLFLYRISYPKSDLYTIIYSPLVVLKNVILCIGLAMQNNKLSSKQFSANLHFPSSEKNQHF